MLNGANIHHIQKTILLSLVSKSPLRFSELQPPTIPNNTFTYHLKKLLEQGYIELTEGGYIATRKALKMVAFGAGRDRNKFSPLPLSMVYVTNKDDEVLLLNRNVKPFQGWHGLPSGLIHMGETLHDAAKRELFEKTTMAIEKGIHEVGVLDLRYVQQETQDIFFHAIAFIFKYQFKGDKEELADLETKHGKLTWSKFDHKHILPEVHFIKDHVVNNKYTYASVNFEEPNHLPVLSAE